MPKILSYTPPWLSRPSPGFNLFSKEVQNENRYSYIDQGRPSAPGPRRRIAKRGTEIFVAKGREIRWADLVHLKEDWEDSEDLHRSKARSKRRQQSSDSAEDDEYEVTRASFRTLKVPVSEEIQQLIPSPNGNLLAVLTTHTVHIAILPNPSHLRSPDTGPIKLKAHTLGPTTHVLSQPAIMSALWHPLGVSGTCVVTVTADAVVRVWELNPENRWSFDSPNLAVDLKKLVDATSSADDFSASLMGRNKGFSPDSFEMEVASACFGGEGVEQENGWASMTLWIAMREGDVYALCPLLPSKWQPPMSLVASLSISTVTNMAACQDDPSASEDTQRCCGQQMDWMKEIDDQEPILTNNLNRYGEDSPVYNRPSMPGPIPKLQGPFELESDSSDDENEDEELITDIYAIAPRSDPNEMLQDEEKVYDESLQGLSLGLICLLTEKGRVRICIDMEGVEGQWLPTGKSRSRKSSVIDEPPMLLTIEYLDTLRQEDIDALSDLNWPTFSEDPLSAYSFFVNNGSGVSYLSTLSWADRLEEELSSSGNAGSGFRLEVLTQGEGTLRERILDLRKTIDDDDSLDEENLSSTAIIIQDPSLGYFLLTTLDDDDPIGVQFDHPSNESVEEPDLPRFSFTPEQSPVPMTPRPSYQPARAFYAGSPLPEFFAKHAQERHRRNLKSEIRLSPATLELMTEAHRVLSQQTHQLGVAAAELFRRCERIQNEFREQIKRCREITERTDLVTGDDGNASGDEDGALHGRERIDQRIQNVQARQSDLHTRYAALRRKLAHYIGEDLSEKEKAWAAEIEGMSKSVLAPSSEQELKKRKTDQPWFRYEEVRAMTDELMGEVNRAVEHTDGEHDNEEAHVKVPSEIRKKKIGQVMGLLERESALVEATKLRLQNLSLA